MAMVWRRTLVARQYRQRERTGAAQTCGRPRPANTRQPLGNQASRSAGLSRGQAQRGGGVCRRHFWPTADRQPRPGNRQNIVMTPRTRATSGVMRSRPRLRPTPTSPITGQRGSQQAEHWYRRGRVARTCSRTTRCRGLGICPNDRIQARGPDHPGCMYHLAPCRRRLAAQNHRINDLPSRASSGYSGDTGAASIAIAR